MSQQNPYEVTAGARSESPASLPRRSAIEWIVLASLAAFPVYWGVLLAIGEIVLEGREPSDLGALAAFCLLGIAGLSMLVLRWRAGPILALLFYALQVVSIGFPSGMVYSIESLPALPLRPFEPAPDLFLQVNLVGLALAILSLRVWTEYRFAADPESAVS